MIAFDFDGVLCDSRMLAMEAFNQLRRQPEFSALPPLADVEDLPTIYAGPLRVALHRWLSASASARFWPQHAALCRSGGGRLSLLPACARLLCSLAEAGIGWGIVSGSHRDVIESVLGRALPAGCRPDYLCSRDEPGSKADKLRRARLDHGCLLYVGDTESDMLHARHAGVEAGFAAYGYGRLPSADLADRIFASPEDLERSLSATFLGGDRRTPRSPGHPGSAADTGVTRP